MNKDTRDTVVFSSVAAALLILSVVFIILGIGRFNSIFTQKDLGVEYTQEDVDNLDDKMGIEITPPPAVTDNSGNSVTVPGETSPGTAPVNDSNKNDYTIVYTEYENKSVQLNATEATVLFNERIQIFSFCENIQFMPSANGTLAMSAMCDVREALAFFLPNEKINIPEGTPARVPFDIVITVTIKDNIINGTIVSVGSGLSSIAPLKPGQKFSGNMDAVNKEMAELFIEDMHVNDEGLLVISGNLPSKGYYVTKN